MRSSTVFPALAIVLLAVSPALGEPDKCAAALPYCLASVGPDNTTVFQEAGDPKSKTGLPSRTGMLCNASTDSNNAGGYIAEAKDGTWGDKDKPVQVTAGQCVPITASGLELHVLNPTAPWNAIWVNAPTPVAVAEPVAKKAPVHHHHPKKQQAQQTPPPQQPEQPLAQPIYPQLR